MSRRSALVAAALVAVVAPAASAATKPPSKLPVSCNLLVDPRGDAMIGGALAASTLDVVSVDLASDAGHISAVIRLNDWTTDDLTQFGGRQWFVTFTPKGAASPLFLSYKNEAGFGAAFGYGTYTGTTVLQPEGTDGSGSVDVSRKEVRITAPVAGFKAKALLAIGNALRDVKVTTEVFAQQGYSSAPHQPMDSGSSKKTYVTGQRSCVKAS